MYPVIVTLCHTLSPAFCFEYRVGGYGSGGTRLPGGGGGILMLI